MVEKGIPEGQTGADGKPMQQQIIDRIKKGKVLTAEEKAERAKRAPTSLVQEKGTAFNEQKEKAAAPEESQASEDPMDDDLNASVFDALMLVTTLDSPMLESWS